MEIREVLTERRRYMELLLMGDEQEDMIERYLERGKCSRCIRGMSLLLCA